MCSCRNIFEDGGLEVAAGNAVVVDEDVIPALGKILPDGERSREIDATVADKDRLLDAFHTHPLFHTCAVRN